MRATLLLLALAAGCSENEPQRVDSGAPPRDTAPASDTGVDAPPVDAGEACFRGTPRTRVEFLNRCTDAETATRTVVLPLLRPDGTLPPLP